MKSMVLLFDVDGVINKSEYFSAQYVKDFDVDRLAFKNFFQHDFAQCLKGQKDVKEVIEPYFQQWKWEKTADDFMQYWFENDVKLDLQLLDFIKNLRQEGHYCALASQQEIYRKKHLWETKELCSIFDDFFCSCDLGVLKSDPKFFEIIIQKLMDKELIQEASEVVFWDDMEKCVAVAQTTGITAKLFESNEDIINFTDQAR